MNHRFLSRKSCLICMLLGVILGEQNIFLKHCSAESRLLVEATEKMPRHGEGSLISLDNGRLLLVYTQWYAGKGDDHAPARLVQIHSDDAGQTWSEPKTVQENIGKMNVMSASLVKTTNGKLLLTYIRIDSNRFSNLWCKQSTDHGETWSDPIQISHGKAGVIFTVNSAATRLKSGRIVLAAYGSPSVWAKDEHYISFSYYSDDEGQTWHKSDNHVDCPKRGAMEPEIEELSDGRIVMLIRTQTGRMYRAYSTDKGKTWSESHQTTIVHPEAPLQIQSIPGNDALLLVWNNATVPGADHEGPRNPLTVGVSYDDGKSWQNVFDIEKDSKGSYCYVTLAFRKNRVHMAYYGPGGLRYQEIPLSKLLKNN